MKVKTIKEAWQKANELFPTESHAMYLMEGDSPMDALEKVSDMLENLGGNYGVLG